MKCEGNLKIILWERNIILLSNRNEEFVFYLLKENKIKIFKFLLSIKIKKSIIMYYVHDLNQSIELYFLYKLDFPSTTTRDDDYYILNLLSRY